MTQEERAKAYDEAIERAKKVLLDCTSEEQKVVEYITPELKESEDERIRKELIDYFSASHATDTFRGIPWDRVVAWLEKQCEQKPVWSDDFEEEMDRYIEDNFYGSADDGFFSNRTKRELEVEDVVRIGCHFAAWQKEQSDKELSDKLKQEWSEEDERRFNNLCFLINQSDENVPTKEGFINWLKSFCHHKHNHTSWWYECIKECVGFKVGNVYNSDGEWIYGDNKKCAYDERFFHPQSHWKPSDEQMYILNWVANILLNHDGIVEEEASKKLQSLYDDLKKLRGE